jgi:hypothetical protein
LINGKFALFGGLGGLCFVLTKCVWSRKKEKRRYNKCQPEEGGFSHTNTFKVFKFNYANVTEKNYLSTNKA